MRYDVLVNGRFHKSFETWDEAKRCAATYNRSAAQHDRGHLYSSGRAIVQAFDNGRTNVPHS